ncbi:kinase-like protein [Sistotremastrum suecicum HHB10207 ss-3]|uniref:non-specific serine/threonine protein kinase n=1 Tax=Sistotremastrum suecicum HHB10207 ss-3 TaxID=1314776 RepID=A0A166FWV6_9AGAM|nr:kinase-like protein [Sistotremastrum suecicum HHB10207 ss-3]
MLLAQTSNRDSDAHVEAGLFKQSDEAAATVESTRPCALASDPVSDDATGSQRTDPRGLKNHEQIANTNLARLAQRGRFGSFAAALREARQEDSDVKEPIRARYKFDFGELLFPKQRVENDGGSFGHVEKVLYRPSDGKIQYVALKTPSLGPADFPKDGRRRFEREARVWRDLRHDNVTEFIHLVQDVPKEGDIILLSTWADLGTAADFLFLTSPDKSLPRKEQFLNIELTPIVVEGALKGLAYLHEQKVYHGDLKGDNILIFGTPGEPIARLTDFGLSKLIAPDFKSATTLGGHFWYAAPEIHNALYKEDENPAERQRLTPQADIWSAGATILELVTGYEPFCHVPELESLTHFMNVLPDEAKMKEISFYLLSVPQLVNLAISRCLTLDPAQRPSAEALLGMWQSAIRQTEDQWTNLLDAIPEPHSFCSVRCEPRKFGPKFGQWCRAILKTRLDDGMPPVSA